ncbi:MAG: single-stranded DNA-binding protein [Eubacteriales bacterium]|nr:single-stranded DNA-binding protein [Eubacteriales bacterium]
MNVITLVGRLTRDPSYSEVQNEKGTHHIASFYLAVPRNYGKEVNYIKVTAFGGQAEFASKYFKRGKRVAVTGELMTGSYKDEETGKTMRTAEVTASRLEFADGKDNTADQTTDEDGFMNIPEGCDDELPFR